MVLTEKVGKARERNGEHAILCIYMHYIAELPLLTASCNMVLTEKVGKARERNGQHAILCIYTGTLIELYIVNNVIRLCSSQFDYTEYAGLEITAESSVALRT